MSNRHLACLLFVTILASSWACAGGGGSAASTVASAVWDQATVTDIAKPLPGLTSKLYDTLYAQGQQIDMPGAMGAGDAYERQKDSIRKMREESTSFVDKLEKGAGRDETIDGFKRMSELNRDVKEFARDQMATEAMTSQMGAVQTVLDQLAPFYGG